MRRRTPPECNLRGKQIRDANLILRVGPEGSAASAEMLTPRGAEHFSVLTDVDGSVLLEDVGDETQGNPDFNETYAQDSDGGSVENSPHPCWDPEYIMEDWKETDPHQWYLNASTIPQVLDQAGAISAIRDGYQNITFVNNDCGKSDVMPGNASYQGTTSRRATACSSGQYDGYNVVDFGPLPGSGVALNCIYTAVWWELTESDIRLDNEFTWTLNPGSSCFGKYDVESVVTHEVGHTFGLRDLDPNTHKRLTMSGAAWRCTEAHRTLGLGDVDGLDLKYHVNP